MFDMIIREITTRRTPKQQLEWRRTLEATYEDLADDEIDSLIASRMEGVADVFIVDKIQTSGATLKEVAEDVTYRGVQFPPEVLYLMAPGDMILAAIGRDDDGDWEALYVRDCSA